jgi:hypothetical protein
VEKFSGAKDALIYAAPCKSIRVVLQGVASSSDENIELTSSEGRNIHGCWYEEGMRRL